MSMTKTQQAMDDAIGTTGAGAKLTVSEATSPFERLMFGEISRIQREVDRLAEDHATWARVLDTQRAAVARARQLLADAEANLAEQEQAHAVTGDLLTQRRLLLVNLQQRTH